MKKLNLHVSGMTCSSCEVLLERNLKKVPGVSEVTVRRSKEEATITCDDATTLDSLQDAVREKGYVLSYKDPIENPPQSGLFSKDKKRYKEIGAALLFIIGIYLILRQFDIIPKSLGVSENMSYGFVFLIGLVAATSTCLAVAGGLLLAVAAKFNQRHPHATGMAKFRPHIYFNIGRIISYTVLGGAIGYLGSILTISPKITGVITIAASVLMIIMGIQLLQIFPWANKIQLKMPKFIAHRIYDASSQQSTSTSTLPSFLFGASTFFLPCGFTQALQLYVLGKADFVTGALTMLAFSLGTLPSLAGIGAFSSLTKGNVQKHFMTFSAVLVIILGLFNIPNGLALTGAAISFGGTAASNEVKIVDGKQIVEMKIVGLDYYPHKFTIIEDIPVEWRVDGTQAEGCARVISVPKLGLLEFIPTDGSKTIEFTPEEVGEISFSCTMGMTTPGAAFEVVPNTADIEPSALAATTSESEESGACNPEIMNCNVQKISMEVSQEKGFYPNVHVVKKGIPVEMEIDTKLQLGGCMSTMVIPEYGVAHFLEKGKTILRFTPTKEGTYPFTCSMGSKQGDFIVI